MCLLAVGLVAGAAIVFVMSSRPSKPNFSARILRFSPGDSNCIISVTNSSKTKLECECGVTVLDGGLRSVETRILALHGFHECSISVSDDPKVTRAVIVVGHQPVEKRSMAEPVNSFPAPLRSA